MNSKLMVRPTHLRPGRDQPGTYGPPSDLAPGSDAPYGPANPYEAYPDQPGSYGPPIDLAPRVPGNVASAPTDGVPTEITDLISTGIKTAGQIAKDITGVFTPGVPKAPPLVPTPGMPVQPPRVPVRVAAPTPPTQPPPEANPGAWPSGETSSTALVKPAAAAITKAGTGTYVVAGIGAVALVAGVGLLVSASSRKRRRRSDGF